MFRDGRTYRLQTVLAAAPNSHLPNRFTRMSPAVSFDCEWKLIPFLKELKERLERAGIQVEGVFLKGGAVRQILSGESRRIPDLDIALNLAPGANLDGAKTLFLEVLAESIGIRSQSLERPGDKVKRTYFHQGREIYSETLHKSQCFSPLCSGKAKGLKTTVINENQNQYTIHTLPTQIEGQPQSIDVQLVVANDINCVTSADALRIDLTDFVDHPGEVPQVPFIAVDGYDPLESYRFMLQHQFRVLPERLKQIKNGLRAYVKILTQGFYPADLWTQRKFHETFKEIRGTNFRSYLNKFLKSHYEDASGKIVYLLNLESLLSSYTADGWIERTLQITRERLAQELLGNAPSTTDISQFCRAAQGYLFLLTELKAKTPFGDPHRAFFAVQGNDAEQKHWLFIPTPSDATLESLKTEIGQCPLLVKLAERFPHREAHFEDFMAKAYQPRPTYAERLFKDQSTQVPTPSRGGREGSLGSQSPEGMLPLLLAGTPLAFPPSPDRTLPPLFGAEVKRRPEEGFSAPLDPVEELLQNAHNGQIQPTDENARSLISLLSSEEEKIRFKANESTLRKAIPLLIPKLERKNPQMAWNLFAAACHCTDWVREPRLKELFFSSLNQHGSPLEIISIYRRFVLFAKNTSKHLANGLHLCRQACARAPEATRAFLALASDERLKEFQDIFVEFLKENPLAEGIETLPWQMIHDYAEGYLSQKADPKVVTQKLFRALEPKLRNAKETEDLDCLRLYNRLLPTAVKDPALWKEIASQTFSILSRKPSENHLEYRTAAGILREQPAWLKELGAGHFLVEASKPKKKKKTRTASSPAKPPEPKPSSQLDTDKVDLKQALTVLHSFREKKIKDANYINETCKVILSWLTPYFVPDQESIHALCNAMESMEGEKSFRYPPVFYQCHAAALSYLRPGQTYHTPEPQVYSPEQLNEKLDRMIQSGIRKKILTANFESFQGVDAIRASFYHFLLSPDGRKKIEGLLNLIDSYFGKTDYYRTLSSIFGSQNYRLYLIQKDFDYLNYMFGFFDQILQGLKKANTFSVEQKANCLIPMLNQLIWFGNIDSQANPQKDATPSPVWIWVAAAVRFASESDKLSELVLKSLDPLEVDDVAGEFNLKVIRLFALHPQKEAALIAHHRKLSADKKQRVHRQEVPEKTAKALSSVDDPLRQLLTQLGQDPESEIEDPFAFGELIFSQIIQAVQGGPSGYSQAKRILQLMRESFEPLDYYKNVSLIFGSANYRSLFLNEEENGHLFQLLTDISAEVAREFKTLSEQEKADILAPLFYQLLWVGNYYLCDEKVLAGDVKIQTLSEQMQKLISLALTNEKAKQALLEQLDDFPMMGEAGILNRLTIRAFNLPAEEELSRMKVNLEKGLKANLEEIKSNGFVSVKTVDERLLTWFLIQAYPFVTTLQELKAWETVARSAGTEKVNELLKHYEKNKDWLTYFGLLVSTDPVKAIKVSKTLSKLWNNREPAFYFGYLAEAHKTLGQDEEAVSAYAEFCRSLFHLSGMMEQISEQEQLLKPMSAEERVAYLQSLAPNHQEFVIHYLWGTTALYDLTSLTRINRVLRLKAAMKNLLLCANLLNPSLESLRKPLDRPKKDSI